MHVFVVCTCAHQGRPLLFFKRHSIARSVSPRHRPNASLRQRDGTASLGNPSAALGSNKGNLLDLLDLSPQHAVGEPLAETGDLQVAGIVGIQADNIPIMALMRLEGPPALRQATSLPMPWWLLLLRFWQISEPNAAPVPCALS